MNLGIGTVTTAGALTVTGKITTNGYVALGSATDDAINANGEVMAVPNPTMNLVVGAITGSGASKVTRNSPMVMWIRAMPQMIQTISKYQSWPP